MNLPDPNHFASIGWVLVSLVSLTGMLKLGLDLWKDHFREDPRPAGTYMTIAGCDKTHADFSRKVSELEADTKAADKELENDIRSLGNKIDETRAALQVEGARRARTIYAQIESISKVVAAVDERSQSTQAEVRLMNQNLIAWMRDQKKS